MAALFLAVFALCSMQRLNAQEQDFDIACFYCHMDIIVEMKAEAPGHWKAGVKCETCHGESMGHVDAEDNSVKPEMIWQDSGVGELCKKCHGGFYAAYGKSVHARRLSLRAAKQTQAKGPSCTACHGYHGFRSEKQIMETCLRCHQKLRGDSHSGSPESNPWGAGASCGSCHDPHSLVSIGSRKSRQ